MHICVTGLIRVYVCVCVCVWMVLLTASVHYMYCMFVVFQAQCLSLPRRRVTAGAEAMCEGIHEDGQSVEAQLWRLQELVCGLRAQVSLYTSGCQN